MILDTNAISALAQKNKSLINRLEGVRTIAVTLISLGEFSYGVRRSNARAELEDWLRKHLLAGARILVPDLSTVEYYADIGVELQTAGTPIPANDIWIAALARQHDMQILSLDTHFDRVKDLVRIDWT